MYNGKYDITDLQEMGLEEIYVAIRKGQVDVETFADYVNGCIALGQAIGKQQAETKH